MDYHAAHEFLHTRDRPVPRKKYANNTHLERRNADTIAVVLHCTDVVTFHRHSPYRAGASDVQAVTLNTGGWLTVTTKERINRVLPGGMTLGSARGTWEVRNWITGDIVRFTEGVTFEYNRIRTRWAPVERTLLPGEDQVRQDRHNASTRRLINRYVTGLTDKRLQSALSYTQNPDACVLCRPHTRVPHLGMASDRERVITVGDAMEDSQHLIDHMHNGEYPFQLLFAAAAERGYIAANVVGHRDIVKRSLRTYLANRLYVGATAHAHGKRPILIGATA